MESHASSPNDTSRKGADSADPADGASPLWLDDYLPYRAGVAASEISKGIAPYYQELGLTLPELAVISALCEESTLTQQMIIARTVMEKFTVSRAVKSLVRRRLVKRSDHETDGRSHWLSLTASGRELFARVQPMSLTYEERMVEVLGGESAAQEIKTTLRKLQDAARSISHELDDLLAPFLDRKR